ncbi:MAG TPA: DUF721 domain-containing protein [Bacteroidota bacterium]|nr:DUF721 domain-containing protein [Bacteroidota bacterium]
MKKTYPKPFVHALSSVLDQLGLSRKIRQYQVLEKWQSFVGEQIAKVAQAERMDGGKLFVHVLNSTWRNELVFLKKELIEKINNGMNQEIVKDIIFR